MSLSVYHGSTTRAVLHSSSTASVVPPHGHPCRPFGLCSVRDTFHVVTLPLQAKHLSSTQRVLWAPFRISLSVCRGSTTCVVLHSSSTASVVPPHRHPCRPFGLCSVRDTFHAVISPLQAKHLSSTQRELSAPLRISLSVCRGSTTCVVLHNSSIAFAVRPHRPSCRRSQ